MGVFMVEAPSGKPLIANDAALTLLGRGVLPDTTRQNLADVYKAFKNNTNNPYPVDEMPIVRGMMGEHVHIDDMVVVRPDGTQTLLEIFGSPVKNDNGLICRQGRCCFYGVQSVCQNLGKTHVMLVKKGFQGVLPCTFDLDQRWPLPDKITKYRGVDMVKPVQDLRIIMLQCSAQAVSDAFFFVNHHSSLFNQRCQCPHFHTLGFQGSKAIGMP